MSGNSSSYDTIPSSSARNSSQGVASKATMEKLQEKSELDRKFDPVRNKPVVSLQETALLLGADGTGSNREAYGCFFGDKFPVFTGNLFELTTDRFQYLGDNMNEVDMCIIANGDANGDEYPLQASQFVNGGDTMRLLSKEIYLDGFDGGGNGHESYELAWWHILHNYDLSSAKRALFIGFGDERVYDYVEPSQVEKYIQETIPRRIPTAEVLKKLMVKFNGNFYFLLNSFEGRGHDRTESKSIRKSWEELFAPYPGRLIVIQKTEEITDVTIGVVALVTDVSLATYATHMKIRGQKPRRIINVFHALKPTARYLASRNINQIELPNLPSNSQDSKSKSGSSRIKVK